MRWKWRWVRLSGLQGRASQGDTPLPRDSGLHRFVGWQWVQKPSYLWDKESKEFSGADSQNLTLRGQMNEPECKLTSLTLRNDPFCNQKGPIYKLECLICCIWVPEKPNCDMKAGWRTWSLRPADLPQLSGGWCGRFLDWAGHGVGLPLGLTFLWIPWQKITSSATYAFDWATDIILSNLCD